MKKIVAIIRRQKLAETKTALDAVGQESMTIYTVEGRGKQKSMIQEVDPALSPTYDQEVRLVPTPSVYATTHSLPKAVTYIPKRMLVMAVPDERVGTVVETLMTVNRTGMHGDGKIFVLPLEEAVRIRTAETGQTALV